MVGERTVDEDLFNWQTLGEEAWRNNLKDEQREWTSYYRNVMDGGDVRTE